MSGKKSTGKKLKIKIQTIKKNILKTKTIIISIDQIKIMIN